jgi:hypothetical protein
VRVDRKKLLAAVMLAAVIFPLCLLALRAERTFVVQVDLWTSLEHPSSAEIFWEPANAKEPGFTPPNSRAFALNPGSNHGTVVVPDDVIALRLDPIPEPGDIRVGRIAIYGPFGLEIAHWDATEGFAAWVPNEQLRDVQVRDSALEMRASGVDPYLELSDLSAARRRAKGAKIAVALGATLALTLILELGLTLLLGRAAPTEVKPIPRIVVFRWLAALLACGFLAGAGYLSWRLLTREPASAFPSGHGYEMTLVDHRGRPLSPRSGELRFMLDPYTGMRNFPSQKTALFTIDENGFRGPPAPRRPLAMVLGGSTAFGHSLASDGETMSAQLNELSPRFGWVNAAVIGFLSGQELGLMVHYADRFHPELYFVLDGWNDLNGQLENRGLRWPVYGFNQTMFYEVEQKICVDVSARVAGELRDRKPVSDADNLELIIETYGENLLKMHAFARSRGARLLVAFQPDLGSKQRTAVEEELWRASQRGMAEGFSEKYRKLIERSLELCKTHGMDCLDLDAAPEIRKHPGVLFVDAVHLNAAGHRVMAEVVARNLARQ